MAAKKKLSLRVCDEAPTRRLLRIDDPRVVPLSSDWAYSLHDGTLFFGQHELATQRARLSKLAPDGTRQDFDVPPFLVARQTRVLRDGTRAIGIEDRRTLHEIDLGDGSLRPVYVSESLTSVDYLTRDLVVAMAEKSALLLARGADGRFVERRSVSHTGFDVCAFEERLMLSRSEKTVRFFGLVNDDLVALGSVTMKFANPGEVLRDGRPTLVLSDHQSWFFVDGLDEALEASSAPAPKKKTAKAKKGPVKLALERKDAGPSRGNGVVGVTARGRTIAIEGQRIVARTANGEATELASFEPGIQIYVASVHPSEERLLVGAAPVFPAALVELDIDTKQQVELGATVQSAAYLGNDHVISLEYQTKRVTVRPRGTPLAEPVFVLETAAAALVADPASGWVLLTGIGALGETPKTELHRLDGVRLVHVADLAPKSKRLTIRFVHELIVLGDTLHIRSGSDWYEAQPPNTLAPER